MKSRHLLLSLVLLIALLLAACSSQAAPTESMPDEEMDSEKSSETMESEKDDMMNEEDASSNHDSNEMKDDDAMMDDKADDMMSDKEAEMDESSDDDKMDQSDNSVSEEKDEDMAEDAMKESPDWFKVVLTDVNSGESFMVEDFRGKVVLVETLAMWCSNCLKQQGQVQSLHELLGKRDDFVSLGIDIDPNENAEALKAYTDNNGFDWVYTVAPTELSREIGQLYGDQFLNPPSTPMLIIDREGEVHLLPFGIKDAESLLEAIQPYLEAEM